MFSSIKLIIIDILNTYVMTAMRRSANLVDKKFHWAEARLTIKVDFAWQRRKASTPRRVDLNLEEAWKKVMTRRHKHDQWRYTYPVWEVY
jgi:hypothetical protein